MSKIANETTQPTKAPLWREARYLGRRGERVLRYQTRIYKATKENKREKVMLTLTLSIKL